MKFNSILKSLSIIPLLAIATGCATVTRGSTDTLVVNSTPSGADVKIYRTNAGFNAKEISDNTIADPKNPGAGPILGSTPGSFKLARKGEYRVEISKSGYKTVETDIGNRVAGAGSAGMAGNVIAGGIVGIIVDSRTGATRDLTPNPLEVTLEPGKGSSSISLSKEESALGEVVSETSAAIDDVSNSLEGKAEEVIEEVVEPTSTSEK
jgi:hypothetical protein